MQVDDNGTGIMPERAEVDFGHLGGSWKRTNPQLVERSTLSAIISAARRITDELDFLVGARGNRLDGELRRRILERSQLHHILANETWVFREEYGCQTVPVAVRDTLRADPGTGGMTVEKCELRWSLKAASPPWQ